MTFLAAPRWRRRIIALILFVGSLVTVVSAQRDQGVVRDEVIYMHAGSTYAAWWSDLFSGKSGTMSEKRITAHFGGKSPTANNREHPPLMKTLFGFSERLVHRRLGWASPTTAYRIPTALMNALLVLLVFLFVGRVWGTAEGVIAALLALMLPRAFFHAGLAAFDAPMVTMWFATVYAYWRALDSKWWCLGFGVVFGLTLATKHNAIMLPAVVLSHYVWVSIRSQRDRWGEARDARGSESGAAAIAGWLRAGLVHVRLFARGFWRTQPLVFPAMLVVGPLVFVAVWPWLWFDTWTHVSEWMRFHFHHVHYNFEYLGKNWNAPPYPWHVAIVTTLFTVPVATLVAGAVGATHLVIRARTGDASMPERAPALLWFLSAGVSMGAFLLGSTPIFGAEKHWAPAIPTICIFAGIGVAFAARYAVDGFIRAGVLDVSRYRIAALGALVGLGGLVVGAATAETKHAQPYALSYYNALAGGVTGGADKGMNRQFWGYAARGVLPWLRDHAPGVGKPATPVYSHDASPAWGVYIREGLLPRSMPDAGHERSGVIRSKFALVVHELHFNRHDYMIWDVYKTVQPVFVLTKDGVPLVSVYARPGAISTATPRPR